MCFTETWLQEHTPDSTSDIIGFQTAQADRDCRQSGDEGGGAAVFENNRWYYPRHVTVEEQLCGLDVYLLATSLHPYHLSSVFTSAIVAAAYIPPSAAANIACDIINSITTRFQTQHP